MDYLTNPSARRYQRYQKKGKDTHALKRFQAAAKKSLFSVEMGERFLPRLKKNTRGAERRPAERHNTAQEEILDV